MSCARKQNKFYYSPAAPITTKNTPTLQPTISKGFPTRVRVRKMVIVATGHPHLVFQSSCISSDSVSRLGAREACCARQNSHQTPSCGLVRLECGRVVETGGVLEGEIA